MAKKALATIPEIQGNIDPAIKRTLTAMKEALEVRLGRRGDPLDEAVTKGDLVDAGIAKVSGSGNTLSQGSIGSDQIVQVPTGALPPIPDTFVATGVFGGVQLSWTLPSTLYSNHSLTEIYRATEPTPTKRVMIGTAVGGFYFDRIAEPEEKTFYYWIRFVSLGNRNGPFSAMVEGTKLPDLDELLAQLSGEIDESVLAQSLNARIDLLDGPATLAGSVAERLAQEADARLAAIESEQQLREEADQSLSEQIDTLSAGFDTTVAAIQTTTRALAQQDLALAQQIQDLAAQTGDNLAAIETHQSVLSDAQTTQASTIQTLQTTVAGNTSSIEAQTKTLNGLSAQYTLTLDVNGYVSGFGTYNDGKTSDFAVVADRFWIAQPNSTGKTKPFIVQNGKVYMANAMIADASIQRAQIGSVSFGTLKDAKGNSVVGVGGGLKAEYIETDSLWANLANLNYAVIGTAQIENAAITSAKIKDAEVGTLKIAGNAVTVPSVATASAQTTSTSYRGVCSVSITIDQPCWVYAATTGYISYGAGWGNTMSRLLIYRPGGAGTEVIGEGGGEEGWTSASHAGAVWCPYVGTVKAELQFQSPSGMGYINSRSVFIMACKR
ncbi:DUF1983 domain-containing protein [Pseudomonas luteola]|uniref:phage tail tip fiber protein n=1 Tax=Pseudomonas luteola TaxID=47886 RepID=UPI003A8A60F1